MIYLVCGMDQGVKWVSTVSWKMLWAGWMDDGQ
jgi:hypothetical protein